MAEDTNIFGPLVTRHEVEQSVAGTLRAWLPDWLAELSARAGRPRDWLPMPRAWRFAARFQEEPDGSFPVIGIGVSSIPTGLHQIDDSAKSAVWRCGVGIFTEANQRAEGITSSAHEQSRWLAGTYTAAIYAVLEQYGTYDGFAQNLEITGVSFDDLAGSETARQYSLGRVTFDLLVDAIVDPSGGPTEPSTDPTEEPDPAYLVEQVTVDVGDDAPLISPDPDLDPA